MYVFQSPEIARERIRAATIGKKISNTKFQENPPSKMNYIQLHEPLYRVPFFHYLIKNAKSLSQKGIDTPW